MATISRTGIANGSALDASHITNIIDALDGTSATATIQATGSFTGSFKGSLDGAATSATTATSATSATTATNATNVAVTNTISGTGPYYPVFVSATSGNTGAKVDSSTYTYNATTNTLSVTSSYATTASYALNAAGGGGSEYMTLRLTTNEKLIDTTTSTFYLGSAGVHGSGTRTGIMMPYDCTIVSASVYTNTPVPSNTTSALSLRLYKDIDTTPVIVKNLGSLDLEQYFDGINAPIDANVNSNSWINLLIGQDATSTCEYFVTCDILIKKV